MIAIVLGAVACVLALFSDNPAKGYVPLFLPIAVQEMVLAVWLIAKRIQFTRRRSGRA